MAARTASVTDMEQLGSPPQRALSKFSSFVSFARHSRKSSALVAAPPADLQLVSVEEVHPAVVAADPRPSPQAPILVEVRV